MFDKRGPHECDGRTPLLVACSREYSDEKDRERVLKMLLDAGANPSALDHLYLTPLRMLEDANPKNEAVIALVEIALAEPERQSEPSRFRKHAS